MRITYLAKISGKEGSGVNKKIAAQILAWRQQGAKVNPVFIVKSGQLPSDFSGLGGKVVEQKSLVSNYLKNVKLERAIFDSKPGVIYLRMSNLPVFSLSKIFIRPVIFEVNTRVFEELKVSYSGIKYFLLKLHFKNLLGRASGYVGVTKECLMGLSNRPSIQVGNSISFDQGLFEEVVKERKPSNVCIFVGSEGCPWHGVDRLIDIAKANPEYEFWVVGYTADNIINFTQGLLPENVKAFGHVTGKEYDDLLRRANVAVGSLAMDRNNMKYSSSLKNRDYLQYGLPTVMQGVDSDLESLECVLSLPVEFTQTEIRNSLRKLMEFTNSRRLKLSTGIQKAISSEYKEKARLAFLKSAVL